MRKIPAHQRLADLVLGRPVTEFIAERRNHGDAWRAIADALRDETDGAIDVSHESVRQWLLAADSEERSA